jgi:hypothetical protein
MRVRFGIAQLLASPFACSKPLFDLVLRNYAIEAKRDRVFRLSVL